LTVLERKARRLTPELTEGIPSARPGAPRRAYNDQLLGSRLRRRRVDFWRHAIEAGTAETEGLGAQHESASPQAAGPSTEPQPARENAEHERGAVVAVLFNIDRPTVSTIPIQHRLLERVAKSSIYFADLRSKARRSERHHHPPRQPRGSGERCDE